MDRVYYRRFYERRFNESEWARAVPSYPADFLNSVLTLKSSCCEA